jgi:hypothetical protein
MVNILHIKYILSFVFSQLSKAVMISQKSSILQIGLVALKITKYFGCFCFTVNNDLTVTLTLIDFVLFFVSLLVGCLIIVNSISRIDYPSFRTNLIVSYGKLCAAYSGIIISLIFSINCFVRYKLFWSTVLLYEEIDQKVKRRKLIINSNSFLSPVYLTQQTNQQFKSILLLFNFWCRSPNFTNSFFIHAQLFQ